MRAIRKEWVGWVAILAMGMVLFGSCSAGKSHSKFGKGVKKCDGRRGIMTPMGPM